MAPLKAASTATFNQVVKAPTTYMLIVAVSLLTFFVGLYRDSNVDQVKGKEEEIVRLRQEVQTYKDELTAERKEKKQLIMALLVSKEVQKALSRANHTDSLSTSP